MLINHTFHHGNDLNLFGLFASRFVYDGAAGRARKGMESGGTESGSSQPKRAPKKRAKTTPLTPEELRAKRKAALDRIRAKVQERRKAAKADQAGERESARRREEARRYPEDPKRRRDYAPVRRPDARVEAEVKQALRLEGLKSPEELQTMDQAHAVISKHYMDPAFMLYMNTLRSRPTGKINAAEVYHAFNIILSHPYAFHYVYDAASKTTKVVKISSSEFIKVPDVSLRIAKEGYIDEVNDTSLDKNGAFPWTNVDYHKKVDDYNQQFLNEWNRVANHGFLEDTNKPTDRQQLEKLYRAYQKKGFEHMGAKMQEAHIHINITIPLRLIQLIESRGNEFETNHPVFRQLAAKKGYLSGLQQLYETNPEEAFKKLSELWLSGAGLEVFTVVDPNYPIYIIGVKGATDYLYVDKQGRIMEKGPGGQMITLPGYQENLKRGYIERYKGKGAEEILSDEAFRKRMEAAGAEAKDLERYRANREYMRPVAEALNKASWAKQKEVMVALLPSSMTQKQKDDFAAQLDRYDPYIAKYPEWARAVQAEVYRAYTEAMSVDPEVTDVIAKILDVEPNTDIETKTTGEQVAEQVAADDTDDSDQSASTPST